ncbi:MAG TPA: hypothetical protein DCE42_10850 [Myxococcales bacterium]|nr:hypothetical protein [Deltaproteobacteria bacterium]MBU54757.1 hypothetical protein [Deltaproteobacteria bacterium]HAA55245.1 hypothetical protein [Myxococcales bacterium]
MMKAHFLAIFRNKRDSKELLSTLKEDDTLQGKLMWKRHSGHLGTPEMIFWKNKVPSGLTWGMLLGGMTGGATFLTLSLLSLITLHWTFSIAVGMGLGWFSGALVGGLWKQHELDKELDHIEQAKEQGKTLVSVGILGQRNRERFVQMAKKRDVELIPYEDAYAL